MDPVILSSTNGVNWTGNNVAFSGSALVFAEGIFQFVGSDDAVARSAGGVNWVNHTTETVDTFYGLTYGKGRFVTVGLGATIQGSIDALIWTNHTQGFEGNPDRSYNFNKIAFGNSHYVVSGTSILSSSNGVTTPAFASGISSMDKTFARGGSVPLRCRLWE